MDNEEEEPQELHVVHYPSQFRALANQFAHEKNLKARRKLLELYGHHLIHLKRSILINRRRWQQRFQRRQAFLRSFFMQHLLKLETNFLELIPIMETQIKNEPSTDLLNVSSCTIGFMENVMGLVNDEDWLSRFHMQKSTFEWMYCQLKEIPQPVEKKSPLLKYISLEKQVALGLYVFASGINYPEINRIFEISQSEIICKFIKCFAETIVKQFSKQFLVMPTTEEELNEIENAFNKMSRMPPAAIGVLGVCELTTKPSKQVTSKSSEPEKPIIMQILIDNKLIFRKVKLDSNQPTLFLEENNDISNLPPSVVNGQTVSRFIVTPDTYYPLRKWLMHRYDDPVEPYELNFNEAVEKIFAYRNRALQRFFARWRILNSKGDLDARTMEKVALACCILHNILEKNEEMFDENWIKLLNIDKTEFNMSTRFKPVLNVLQGRTYWKADGAVEVRKFLGQAIIST